MRYDRLGTQSCLEKAETIELVVLLLLVLASLLPPCCGELQAASQRQPTWKMSLPTDDQGIRAGGTREEPQAARL